MAGILWRTGINWLPLPYREGAPCLPNSAKERDFLIWQNGAHVARLKLLTRGVQIWHIVVGEAVVLNATHFALINPPKAKDTSEGYDYDDD